MAVRRDVDIEALLHWAYARQKVDLIVRGVGLAVGVGGYGDSAIAHDYVDATAIAAQEVHPDAEAVHRWVMAQGWESRRLVIHHAKTFGRPDWMPGAAPRLRGIFRPNGKPVMVTDRNGRPIYCPLEYLLMEENIAFARARYVLWWETLNAAAHGGTLQASLAAHRIAGFRAPFEPWSAVEAARHAA